jgi:hypothetical protein
MHGSGGGKHQPVVGGDGELGIAQIGDRIGEARTGLPFLEINGAEDADRTVLRHVRRSFAECQIPAFTEPDEVREGAVRRAIPHLVQTYDISTGESSSSSVAKSRDAAGTSAQCHILLWGGALAGYRR